VGKSARGATSRSPLRDNSENEDETMAAKAQARRHMPLSARSDDFKKSRKGACRESRVNAGKNASAANLHRLFDRSRTNHRVKLESKTEARVLPVANDPRAMAGPRSIRCRVCPAAPEIYYRSVEVYPWLRAITTSLAASLRFGVLSHSTDARRTGRDDKRERSKARADEPTEQPTELDRRRASRHSLVATFRRYTKQLSLVHARSRYSRRFAQRTHARKRSR